MEEEVGLYLAASKVAREILINHETIEKLKKLMKATSERLKTPIKDLEAVYIMPLLLSQDSTKFSLHPVVKEQRSVLWDSILTKPNFVKVFPFVESFVDKVWIRLNDFKIKVKKDNEEVEETPLKTEEDFPIYIVHSHEFFIEALAQRASQCIFDRIVSSAEDFDMSYMKDTKGKGKKKTKVVEVSDDEA